MDAITGFGSSEAASKGGKARAQKLSPQQRQIIARRAVETRWVKEGKSPLPKASHEGELDIGNGLSCAVLDDGRRVITQSAFYLAIGRSRTPKAGTGVLSTVDGTPFFLQAETLKPFISTELEASIAPVFYEDLSGRKVPGYNAELLPMVAEVYLKLRDSFTQQDKPVPKQYAHIVVACDILMRALARVGIIALIDEATGFQYERPRRDLAEYLKKFVAESLVRWARTFPNDYFKHLCRLKGVTLRPDMRLPQYFGIITNDLVYRRIAPGLLKALKERRAERGKPSNKLHWWTSKDLGHPSLLLHLGQVVGLMKIHTDYEAFHKQLDVIAPVYPEMPGLFDDPADWDSPATEN